jgi:aminoglycoside phosphotransferase (APT) family kinase protein
MIDAALVHHLVSSQFPQWADLPIRPVERDGWDNCTFRLGATMSVRLPSSESYAAQVDKEQQWLPVLGPQLPLPIPVPIAKGAPVAEFGLPWSVYQWLPGDRAELDRVDNLKDFAVSLAGFLNALYGVDALDGPPDGEHNFFRGGPLVTYDEETRAAIEALHDQIPAAHATALWESALASSWSRPPVWVHGDVANGNLLVTGGRLSAVIDFGSSGVGDPACDTVIAWTFLSGSSRAAFKDVLLVDDDTWTRGRGWALWKALITIRGEGDATSDLATTARAVLDEVLSDRG